MVWGVGLDPTSLFPKNALPLLSYPHQINIPLFFIFFFLFFIGGAGTITSTPLVDPHSPPARRSLETMTHCSLTKIVTDKNSYDAAYIRGALIMLTHSSEMLKIKRQKTSSCTEPCGLWCGVRVIRESLGLGSGSGSQGFGC